MSFQKEKKLVLEYFEALEKSNADSVQSVLSKFTNDDYIFKASHPVREQKGANEAAQKFWQPLMRSLVHMQRRQDVFMAGYNEINEDEVWVMSMGHFSGIFADSLWGIEPTGKMANLRYAEFNHVKDGKIVHTGLFFDLLGFMQLHGVNPMPPDMGNYFVYPGPKDHNGLLFDDADQKESLLTKNLMNGMVDDLTELNKNNPFPSEEELLANNEKSWAKDMVWYGPSGVGAQYTILGYQRGHQMPFRYNLKDKVFNGHVCRISEGNFSCFFGWPNLSNVPTGGFLGLPGGEVKADMQVVDVYYRKGDKLSENWVIIDFPYWLKMQGLDVIERNKQLLNPLA